MYVYSVPPSSRSQATGLRLDSFANLNLPPRSTFLKRKGGLFKKAHELSVLCSVDVAVFIFGQNKKLYEYTSGDMRELMVRYNYVSSPSLRVTWRQSC